MAAQKKQLLKIKRKKKRWFPIVAPKLFSGVVLGESYISDSSLLEGKFLTVNLMNITGDAKKQNINVQFSVTSVSDGKGQTSVTRLWMLPSSVKRMVRRGRDKIDDSFTVKTKDGKFVVVKPVIITNSNTYKSLQTRLRMAARETLAGLISNYTYEELLDEMFSFKLQKHLKDTLNKIYPVRNCGIRHLGILTRTPRKVIAPPKVSIAIPKAEPEQENPKETI